MDKNAPNDVRDDSDHATQLQAIASEIESYFGVWISRCRQAIEEGRQTPAGEATLASKIRRFEETRSQWEAQRERELDSIAEKSEQLSCAWLQLESEQREFLQLKETWKRRMERSASLAPLTPEYHSSSSHRPREVEPPTASESPFAAATQVPVTVCPPSSARIPKPAEAPLYPIGDQACRNRVGNSQRILAIRQFEQLRREVDSTQRMRHPKIG
jgi:hypothetical protein